MLIIILKVYNVSKIVYLHGCDSACSQNASCPHTVPLGHMNVPIV